MGGGRVRITRHSLVEAAPGSASAPPASRFRGPSPGDVPRLTDRPWNPSPPLLPPDCPESLVLPISQKTYSRTYYEYRPSSTATFATSSRNPGREVRGGRTRAGTQCAAGSLKEEPWGRAKGLERKRVR